MALVPLFFSAIGTVPQAQRLAFLTQDVRAAGTVLGFYGAAAAIGAKPGELALMVVRRYQPTDRDRQIVIVYQQDAGFSGQVRRLYAARGKPLGFEAQNRWCTIPEPHLLRGETFALLAARFKTLLLIEETGDGPSLVVFASQGFQQRPGLKLAPLPKPPPKPVLKPASGQPEAARQLQARPAAVRADRMRPAPPVGRTGLIAAPVPLARKRRLRSVVALNAQVERKVVDEFRRLLQVVSYYG